MPQRCTICAHPQREEIDKALVEGMIPITKLSTLFNASYSALRRHRDNHLPETLKKAQAVEEVAQADDLLGQVKGLRNKAYSILVKAEKKNDLRTALSAIKEARSCLELLAKLIGELDERPQINILFSPQWVTIRAVLLDALQPFPEARQAAARALLEVSGEHGD